MTDVMPRIMVWVSKNGKTRAWEFRFSVDVDRLSFFTYFVPLNYLDILIIRKF